MKYYKLLGIIMLIYICICTGCEKDENIPDAEIDQNILLVSRHVNFATTYTNKGYFIDKEGNKIEFDLSNEDEKYADINELIPYLEQLENSEVKDSFSKKDVQKIYYYLYKIDKNSEITKKSVGCDQGGTSLYGIQITDGKVDPILLKGEGDWEKTNTDEYAKKIVKMVND